MFQSVRYSGWCLALLGVLLGTVAAQDKDKLSPALKVELAARQIAADLRDARALLAKIADKELRERLELLIGRAELQANDMQKESAALTNTANIAVISAEDFAKIVKGLKAQSFDDSKLAFIKGLGKTTRFSSGQARELLAPFSFDDQRVAAAIWLHPQLSDPVNFFQVLEVFTFDSNRQLVREKLQLK